MNWSVHCADVLDWCARYEGPKFHAVLCDPPYHLKGGFMGKYWDRDGPDAIAFQSETWQAIAEHLYPGAFILAFGGSRTYHRLAVAAEDAGLIIHPALSWLNGCLDEDTEILTVNGWQPYTRLFAGLSVMCYNVTDNSFSYQPIERVYVYDYDDTAFRIVSDTTDQLVTANHRCLIERSGSIVFQQAATLERQEIVPILEAVSGLPETLHSYEQRRILQDAYLWGEGLYQRDDSAPETWKAQANRGTQGYGFDLSYMRDGISERRLSPEAVESWSDLLTGLQWQAQGTRPQAIGAIAGSRGNWSGGVVPRDSREMAQGEAWGKQPSLEGWRYLSQETRQLCQLFYQICEMPGGVHQYGPQGWLCDGASLDSGATPGPDFETFRGGTPQGSQPREQRPVQLAAIQQQYGSQEVRTYWKTATTLAIVEPTYHKGRVWCVSVPTGAFVARRNGHVFITGNSGFPKATRIDTQIDKAAGVEREVVGSKLGQPGYSLADNGRTNKIYSDLHNPEGECAITAPATPLAATWAGHRYGLQALKPCAEFILCAQKPYVGRPVDCITSTGAGALNIDQSRVATGDTLARPYNNANNGVYGKYERFGNPNEPQGRWPPNVVLSHLPDCERVGMKRVRGSHYTGDSPDEYKGAVWGNVDRSPTTHVAPDGTEAVDDWACVEGCPVKALGEMSGERKLGGDKYQGTGDARGGVYDLGIGVTNRTRPSYADKGTAARFYPQFSWQYEIAERLAGVVPFKYQAKSSRRERDQGLEGMMKLRDDLTPEQKRYVLGELERLGIDGV